MKHCFVILAYKQSEYLESCIQSLMNQTIRSDIVISTSTPSGWLDTIAEKHHIKLYTNSCQGGIAMDWNYALAVRDADLITLAHQDDIYQPNYLHDIFRIFERHQDTVIAFTNYSDLKKGEIIRHSVNLCIKRMMLLPLLFHSSIKSRFARRSMIRFGNPICCPSVTYNMIYLRSFQFSHEFTINLDWDAWIRLADTTGRFAYESKIMFLHRIHDQSETSHGLNDNRRQLEDYEMFKRLLPAWLANIVIWIYGISYKSNKT